MMLSDTMTVSKINSMKTRVYLLRKHLKTAKLIHTCKHFRIDFSVPVTDEIVLLEHTRASG